MELIQKYVFKGYQEGLNLLVLGGIHGNETAGVRACQRMIKQLKNGEIKLQKGRLTLVPICNPKAYDQGIRCMEENLNRVMKMHVSPKTYEQFLANEICPLIKENRMLLDLHSTHCEGDVPFAFCDYADEYNTKLIDALKIGFVLEGWPKMYARQGEIPDFSTEGCAHFYGNTGTTLECGYHRGAEAETIAYEAILSALKVYGMIDEEFKLPSVPKTHILMQSYELKTGKGKFCRDYKHLDPVQKGEKIACYDCGKFLQAPADGYVLLPNPQAEIGTEWFYFGTKVL